MYVGTQVAPRNVSDLAVWSQLGVNNVCADPFEEDKNGNYISINPHEWTIEILEKHIENRKNDKGSIIFGLDSFAEGVDLKGDNLNHVFISKLRFGT